MKITYTFSGSLTVTGELYSTWKSDLNEALREGIRAGLDEALQEFPEVEFEEVFIGIGGDDE